MNETICVHDFYRDSIPSKLFYMLERFAKIFPLLVLILDCQKLCDDILPQVRDDNLAKISNVHLCLISRYKSHFLYWSELIIHKFLTFVKKLPNAIHPTAYRDRGLLA